MPEPRRVRCPTCKAGLAEPSTLVYKCPFCSTFLQAKSPASNDHGRTDNRIHPTNSTAMETPRSSESSSGQSSTFSSSNSSVSDKTTRIVDGDDDDNSSSSFSVDDHLHIRNRIMSQVPTQSSVPSTRLSKSESPHSVSVPSYDCAEAESQCEDQCSLITNRSDEQIREEDSVAERNLGDLFPARRNTSDEQMIDSKADFHEESSRITRTRGEGRHERSSTKLGWHTRESKAGHSDAASIELEEQESKLPPASMDHGISTTSNGGSAPQLESDERTTLDFDLYGEYDVPEIDMYAPPLLTRLQQQPQSVGDFPPTETGTDIYKFPRRKQIQESRSKLDNRMEEKRELHPASSRFPVAGADCHRLNRRNGFGLKFPTNPEEQLDSSGASSPRHRLHHPENLDLDLLRYREWAAAQTHLHVRHNQEMMQNDVEKRRKSFDQKGTSKDPHANCSSIPTHDVALMQNDVEKRRKSFDQKGTSKDPHANCSSIPGISPAQSVAPWMFDHKIDACSHHSVHPICAFCIQQSYLLHMHCATCSVKANAPPHHTLHVPPQFGTQLAVEYPSKQPDHQENMQTIRKSSKNPVIIRREKRFPPFPIGNAAPFVLCQHCAKLLQVPSCLPPTDDMRTQKLRCGSCSKVSTFSVCHSGSLHSSRPSSGNPSRSSTNNALPVSIDQTIVRSDFGEATRRSTDQDTVQSWVVAKDQKTVRSDSCEAPRSSTQQVSNPWRGEYDNSLQRPQGQDGINYRRSNAVGADASKAPSEARSANAEISEDPIGERVPLIKTEKVRETGASLQNGALRRLGSKNKREVDNAVAGHHLNKSTSLRENQGRKFPLSTPELSNGVTSNEDSQPESAAANAHAQVKSSSADVAHKDDDQTLDLPPPLETAVPGSPLHEHFGYRTPGELLQRYFSYRDAQTDVSSATHTQFSARPSNVSHGSLANHTFRPSSPFRGKFWNQSLKSSQTCDTPRASVDGQLDWLEGSRFEEQVSLYPGHNHNASHSRKGFTNKLEGGGERKFAGFLKRSLKDLAEKGSLLTGNSRQKVIINGHVVPNSAIKKAEEHAGKLHPGSYWYDYKVGFWGVSGGPCMGIIPPFIKYLNYPMPRDCANGTTRIFVNGRELHQKDLVVLARRGLPMEPDKAYSVEFDGTVIDEASGQQLKGLGTLAPTVERLGKGFGMSSAKAYKK